MIMLPSYIRYCVNFIEINYVLINMCVPFCIEIPIRGTIKKPEEEPLKKCSCKGCVNKSKKEEDHMDYGGCMYNGIEF